MIFFTVIFSKFYKKFRSSHQRCSIKEALLKNFVIFTGIHLQACNFIKKRLQHRHFSVNIVKFLRTPILKNTWEHCFCKFQSGHIFQENLSLPKRNALISGIFNLGELVYWTQVQNESRGFYLPYFPKTFSKVWAENTCCVFSKKSSEFLFFRILFSAVQELA